MKSRPIASAALILSLFLFASVPFSFAANTDETVLASPALIREIQFMLLTVGIDPGPIDGNARQLTNRAARTFQSRASLPQSDVITNGQISAAFLERLRKDAAQVMLRNANQSAPAAAPSSEPAPPVVAITPPSPAPTPQPSDPFTSCSFKAEDFRIGGKEYTAQGFLDEGFAGSTAGAVTNLRKRLDEARQLADRIGGSALLEVQRQARVLSYFECRLKIEQGSTKS